MNTKIMKMILNYKLLTFLFVIRLSVTCRSVDSAIKLIILKHSSQNSMFNQFNIFALHYIIN